MLFQELKRLAASPDVAPDLTPEGYARKPVRYVIKLDREGRRLGPPIDRADGQARQGAEMDVPAAVRSAGTFPLLLADRTDYLFGLEPDPAKAHRALARRQAFLGLVEDCASRTGRPEVEAVRRYLASGDVPEDLDPSAEIVTFDVAGCFVVELPEVRRYWAQRLQLGLLHSSGPSRQQRLRESRRTVQLECLVCGRLAPCAKVWPVLIKGIPGGKTFGNQLVSANEPAFESYGLKRSRTSPACLDCAAGVGKALNWLIARDAHHLRTPAGVYVFWTREQREFSPTRMLSDPEPEDVGELLRSPRTGRQGAIGVSEPDFFAAELSTSGSRVVVRSWIETTVPEVKTNLARYFRRQEIVQWDGGPPRWLGIAKLVRATTRELRQAHPFAAHDLIEVALTGRPAPDRLVSAAVRRSQAERRVTTARAALMRLALLADGKSDDKEEFMSELDPGNPTPAYLCGRLLAELEAAQRAAQGTATIIDRYYGAASSSPATVFGPLLRGAQHHMGKLKRDKPGAYRAIDGRLTNILESLRGGFPALLTIRDQAVFALGYYQQKAADRAAARARKELADTVDLNEKEEQA